MAVDAAKGGAPPSPPDRAATLEGVRWDVAQDAMTPEAVVIVAGVARLLAIHAQDEMRKQVPDPTRRSGRVRGVGAQDEMEVAAWRRQRDRVEVDLHQLELRHRDVRIHDGEQRRRLIGSMAEIGQQVPIVVIGDADRLVLIDGYLRVEALRRLHRDTAIATTWPVTEVEALVHHRHLAGAKRAALEDAWLLGRLREHDLTMEQLARELCRSTSWVSRRLALLAALDGTAHDRVRAGTVPQGLASPGQRYSALCGVTFHVEHTAPATRDRALLHHPQK